MASELNIIYEAKKEEKRVSLLDMINTSNTLYGKVSESIKQQIDYGNFEMEFIFDEDINMKTVDMLKEDGFTIDIKDKNVKISGWFEKDYKELK